MVRTEKMVSERRHTAGDAAVDGLLAGAAGGVAMAAVLVASGLLAGAGPASTLAHFSPAGSASPLTGGLIHLAVSAVYGLLFGVIYRLVRRGRLAGWPAGVILGMVYGAVLALVAQGLADEQGIRRLHPIVRIGEVGEIAGAVLWMCSTEAGFMTGHAMTVDGGMTAV